MDSRDRTAMNGDGFREGKITYAVKTMTSAELAAELQTNAWADGFVAFSNTELRLKDAKSVLAADKLAGRVIDVNGAEGYVMEIGLWRQEGNSLFELSAEREDNGFFIQTWCVETLPPSGEGNCLIREAMTEAGSHHKKDRQLFRGHLNSVEVVWPEHRMNFFITKGEA